MAAKSFSWTMPFSSYAMRSLEPHWSIILSGFTLTYLIVAWTILNSAFSIGEQAVILITLLGVFFTLMLVVWGILYVISTALGEQVKITVSQKGIKKEVITHRKRKSITATWKDIIGYHVHEHSITLRYKQFSHAKPHHLVIPDDKKQQVLSLLRRKAGKYKPAHL